MLAPSLDAHKEVYGNRDYVAVEGYYDIDFTNGNVTIETDSFSGKLDVVRKKTNSVSNYLKNAIDKKDEEDKNIAILLDKDIKKPFRGKKSKENNKKKNDTS